VKDEPEGPSLSRDSAQLRDTAPDNVFDIVDISPDGRDLLMREEGRREGIEIWYCRDWGVFPRDLKSDQLRDPFREGDGLTRAFFSSNGRFVVETAEHGNSFLTKSGEVRVWDVDTRRIVSPRTPVPDQAVDYDVTPANMILSVSLMDGSLIAWNLMRNRNAREEKQLFPDEDLEYTAYLTPNATQLLSFWNEEYGEFDSSKMSLFDLRSGSAIWPHGVPTSAYRGVSHVSFSPDGSRFVLSLYHPENQFADPLWRMYRTTDGSLISEFKGIIGRFRELHFDLDGTILISAEYEYPGKIKIRRWSALSGDPLPAVTDFSRPADTSAFVEFKGFTRFADYCVMARGDDSRNLIVQRVGAGHPQRFEAHFADYGTSELAIALLQRAREVRLEGSVIRLTVNSGATISIRHSPLGDQILDERSGSQLRLPLAPSKSNLNLDMMESAYGTIEDISDDATLVVVETGEHQLRIYETRTGQSVSEPLWQEARLAAVKFMGQGQLLTVDKTGLQRLWYVGELNRHVPTWMNGLGEALSGVRLVAQTELQQIHQNEYGPLRQKYIEKLRRAAESGDSEARTILANLQP